MSGTRRMAKKNAHGVKPRKSLKTARLGGDEPKQDPWVGCRVVLSDTQKSVESGLNNIHCDTYKDTSSKHQPSEITVEQ